MLAVLQRGLQESGILYNVQKIRTEATKLLLVCPYL
jgi:hypothetical protein